MNELKKCTICPRNCGVDRTKTVGFCGATEHIKVARASLHFWEEPCISGTKGSGTVFFSGCNLACRYCQNYEISIGGFGDEITVERLAEIFLELQNEGAHNINLVTPTPYFPLIMSAIDLVRDKMQIPFVANVGGYEKSETIRKLKGYIDIFLTDIKYHASEISMKYSSAPNYFVYAMNALAEMISLCGDPKFNDEGIMTAGVIVRHLVLPGFRKDSIDVLQSLAERFGTEKFILSLMSQYTPNGHLEVCPELSRRVTSFEYRSVVDAALELGFHHAYMQEKTSASSEYTPPFDLTGVRT
ncbi:MAG: radical SAM protein [Clostridia bacterium]|nr:radical SAM protein [Clostridia bacterium]